MSLFSNVRYVPTYRRGFTRPRAGTLMATIAPWVSMYLAALMILMFALVGVSLFAVHLRPSPPSPGNDFGDTRNPPRYVVAPQSTVGDYIPGTARSRFIQGGEDHGTII